MIDIKENQKLDIDNVLSYRGKVRQAELEGIGKEMEIYIQKSGAERAGSPATATYGVEGLYDKKAGLLAGLQCTRK